jgi:hypothetical protein
MDDALYKRNLLKIWGRTAEANNQISKTFITSKYTKTPKQIEWSRDSSVGIAAGYGLDNEGEREFESR